MTIKTKNIVLISAFVFGLFICYHFGIKKTVELKAEYNTLKAEELQHNNSSKQLALLGQKQRHYDSILRKNQLSIGSFQNGLLKLINSSSNENQLKIVQFLNPHISEYEGYNIKTFEFVVKGGYNAIINLAYRIEQETSFGEIVNLHFETKTNFRTNVKSLECRFLLSQFNQM